MSVRASRASSGLGSLIAGVAAVLAFVAATSLGPHLRLAPVGAAYFVSALYRPDAMHYSVVCASRGLIGCVGGCEQRRPGVAERALGTTKACGSLLQAAQFGVQFAPCREQAAE